MPIHPAVQWCEQQRPIYERQLELLESGIMRTSQMEDGQMHDTTADSIKHVQRILAELNQLIEEYGDANPQARSAPLT